MRVTPGELDAGSDMELQIRVSCASACDLRGRMVKVITQDAVVVKEVELTEFDGTGNEIDGAVVTALAKPGAHTWTVLFPAQEVAGVWHQESAAPFSFTVKPHTASISVRDIPSPIACGDEFRIKVEVKCSAGCSLARRRIAVYDHEGAKVAMATLADRTGPAGTILSVAEVALKAPSSEGRYGWTVKLPGSRRNVAHAEASCAFAFGVAKQPEHVVTIEAIERSTRTPIRNAHVILRPAIYRGSAYVSRTGDDGVAKVSVPKGDYQVYVKSNGKDTFLPKVEVASDLTIQAELEVVDREWWEY
jgi:hypothetical protein